jgi:lambda repressor-like predicted transcriptional regulator
MSELQVQEPVEVLVPLTLEAAEKLDGRIRRLAKQAGDQLVQVGRLLDEAKAGRIHEALGHVSWTAYVADAVGGQLQLSSESRQAMVQLMAGEGMSVRAIATATGVSKSTVSNDLTQVSNDWTPEHDSGDSGVQELDTSSPAQESAIVTGLDGKTYTKPRPKPKKEDAGPAQNPRKVVERMAPKVEALAAALQGLDPNEVDPDALREKVGTIRGAVGRITEFIDKIAPPPAAASPAVESEATRKPQIPSVLRRNIGQVNELLKEVNRLRSDDRWDKAVERFTTDDVIAVGLALSMLSDIDKALGGDGMPAGDPFEGVGQIDTLADAAGIDPRVKRPVREFISDYLDALPSDTTEVNQPHFYDAADAASINRDTARKVLVRDSGRVNSVPAQGQSKTDRIWLLKREQAS